MKESEDKQTDITCSWVGRLNIVKNDHTTQGNLKIQCNPCQNTNGIFHRTRTNNFKFSMETQKTLITKLILR